MDPKERLKTVATGMSSNAKTKTVGEKGMQPTSGNLSSEVVEELTKDWPKLSKKNIEQMIDKYGLPNEAVPSRLIWYNTGNWKRTIVYRDEIPHNFPQPHSDTLEQVIDYHVPVEKYSEIAKFDGSIIIERTAGEVAARCDMEAANILAFNMMHKIATGEYTAEEAREKFSEQTAAYVMNRPAPFAEKLQFELPTGDTMDIDNVTIGDDVVIQTGKKIKDKLKGK